MSAGCHTLRIYGTRKPIHTVYSMSAKKFRPVRGILGNPQVPVFWIG